MESRRAALFCLCLFGLTTVCSAWAPYGTHARLARAMLTQGNPDIGRAFAKTGWNLEQVVLYADRCDDDAFLLGEFPFNEKQTFPGMWNSIQDLSSFDRDYLTYAKAGKKVLQEQQCFNLNTGAREYPTAQQMSDPRFYQTHRVVPAVVYYGEKLFGIVLHQVADCAMPTGHAPALTWCPSTSETSHEIDALAFPVTGTADKFVVANYLVEQSKEYWASYCNAFYEQMHVNAVAYCNGINNGTLNWDILAETCFRDAIMLANVVVLRYIYASREYITAMGCYPQPCEALQFDCYNGIGLKQLFYQMRLLNTMVPIPEIDVSATLRIPDGNSVMHYYSAFEGQWVASYGAYPNIASSYRCGSIPVYWPSDEKLKEDGTYGHELQGTFGVSASAAGYFPGGCGGYITLESPVKAARNVPFTSGK